MSLINDIKHVINVGGGEWSYLANGTSVLLRARGVHRYKNAFDHAMLESQLSVTVRTMYTAHLHNVYISPLTSIFSGIVQSIVAAQRTLFLSLPRMASSHMPKPSLAFSKLAITNFGFTFSTSC